MPAPSPSIRIFIVEDNEWYGQLLAYKLAQNPDYHVSRFTSAKECLQHLGEKPDVISLDYSLPDGTGDQLMLQIKQQLPSAAIVIISGQEDVQTAINLLQQGAYDYLVKADDTPERLWNAVGKVQEQLALRRENQQLRQQLVQQQDTRYKLLGESLQMNQLRLLIEKAARTTINVSLTGETGTGKELVARAIHYQSSRNAGPFVAVNMAAVPHELVESELFGHEKGAFTGAINRRIGRFEEAHHGTLFLDEIADLDLAVQAKLLRVLQEREVTRVGGTGTIPFDARLIVATHHDLTELVRTGRFREDLYYRLLGLPIVLPPLRERGDDILLLSQQFLAAFCAQNNLPALRLSPEAQRQLLSYPFPGNVRELKAVVELAAVLADKAEIKASDLALRSPGPEQPSQFAPLRIQIQRIVQRCLEANQGNIIRTAAQLQIGKSTIYRMLQNQQVQLR